MSHIYILHIYLRKNLNKRPRRERDGLRGLFQPSGKPTEGTVQGWKEEEELGCMGYWTICRQRGRQLGDFRLRSRHGPGETSTLVVSHRLATNLLTHLHTWHPLLLSFFSPLCSLTVDPQHDLFTPKEKNQRSDRKIYRDSTSNSINYYGTIEGQDVYWVKEVVCLL